MRTIGKPMAWVAVAALAASAGCASRGNVRTDAAAMSERIDTLAAAVEENEERSRQNRARIEEVNQRAVRQEELLGQQAEAATAAARAIYERIDQLEGASNRLIFELTISEAQGNFQTNQAELPEALRMRLDEVVARIRAEHRNVYLEIEGHTDDTGAALHNLELGQQRADAVKTYLYEQHNVPLHKMNVLSYGETRPAAPNNTAEGRAQNRRVVIRVVS